MKVRMLVSLGGQWPPAGEEVDVEDWRVDGLVSMGWAELVDESPPDDEVGDDG